MQFINNDSEINSRNYTNLEILASWSMPISFFFMQYKSFIGTVTLTWTTILAFLFLLQYRGTDLCRLFRPFMMYTSVLVLRTFVNIVFSDNAVVTQGITIMIQYCLLAVSVQIVSKHIDIDRMYRSWCLIALIISAVVIWQCIQIYLMHQNVYPIKLLPFSDSANWNMASSRPVAFFTEPAVIVALLTPVMFMSLRFNRIKFAAFLSVCCLLSMSTTAIIACVILWGFYIYKSELTGRRKAGIVILLLAFSLLLYFAPIFQGSIDKLQLELSGDSSNTFGRMVSGWLVYQHLDTVWQVFGIQSYDISGYLHNHSEFYPYLSQIRTASGAAYFFNTAQRICLTTGAIGAMFYIHMLIKLYKSLSRKTHPYLIYVIVIMFFASNFYMSNFFIMQFFVLFAFLEFDTSCIECDDIGYE